MAIPAGGASLARATALAFAAGGLAAVGVVVSVIPSATSVAVACAVVGAVIVVALAARVASTIVAEPREARPAYALFLGGLLTYGLLILRPFAATTLSDWLFLAATIAVAPVLIRRGRRDAPPMWVWAGLIVFSSGALLSSAGSLSPAESLGVLARLVFILSAWLWCAILVFDSWSSIRVGLIAWGSGAALTSFGVVVQLVLGDVIPGAVNWYGRLSGFTDSFNGLGAIVAISLPVAVALVVHASRTRRTWLAALAAAQAVVMVVATIMSGSVGALVAASIGMVALVAGSRRGRGSFALVVALAVAIVVVAAPSLGGQASPLARLSIVIDPANGGEATLWTRIESYAAAWEVISRGPVVGVGLASADAVTSTGTSVHNLVLASWYEAGLLGLAGSIVLVAGYFVSAVNVVRRRASRRADAQWDALTSGVAAAGISALVVALQEPILFQRFFWLPLTFLLPIASIMARAGQSVDPIDAVEESGRSVVEQAPQRRMQ